MSDQPGRTRDQPAEAVSRAHARLRAGDVAGAATLLEALCHTTPSADAWCLLGAVRGQQGRLEECLAAVDAALALDAGHADAHYNRAQACMHLGKPGEAAQAYREVVRLRPDHVLAWNNLGYSLSQCGAFDEAISCYHHALALRPHEPEILNNLGNALAGAGKTDEAIASYEAAIRAKPGYAAAHFGLAGALRGKQQLQAAITHYRIVVRHHPDEFDALRALGQVLKQSGQLTEAAHWFREALRVRPDHAGTRFQLATVTPGEAPAKAPDTYVRNLFDSYAGSFDESLVQQLQYRTPQLLHALVRQVAGEHHEQWTIADLGCGTGLCGPLFRDRARRLIGVDLSPGMIEAARAKGLYDDLHVGDVVAFLDARAEPYDLVIAADVFPYLGDLANVFRACRAALAPRGLFAFSTEASLDASAPYELRTTARYAHAETYLHALARETSFVELGFEKGVLRMNGPQPVHGYIVVLRAA